MTQKTLAIALGLVLGSAAFGSAQAQEQGIRPVPEDLASQTDERTEDTMPYPEDSVQGADTATDATVQDAVAAEDEMELPLEDESDAETASTDVSEADEAAAADSMADTSELPTDDATMGDPTDATSATDATTATDAAAATDATATAATDTRDIAPGSLSSPATLEQALETRFQSGDENGDGTLSESEIAALDDDDLVFATIDADADGSVSREEWGAQLQTQVASADNDAGE